MAAVLKPQMKTDAYTECRGVGRITKNYTPTGIGKPDLISFQVTGKLWGVRNSLIFNGFLISLQMRDA